MVAIDTNTGAPVRLGGAALLGGPALSLLARPRGPDALIGVGGAGFPNLATRLPQAPAAPLGVQPAPPPPDVLPANWGIPTFFADAPFGPPYELPNRTMEWQLSAAASQTFRPVDKSARMVQRVHPKGPELQSAGMFLSALYGMTPTPSPEGVGLDTWG